MSTLVSVSTVRSNNNLDIYFHGDSGITFYDRSRWRVKISLQMSKLKMTFHLDKTVLLHMIIYNKKQKGSNRIDKIGISHVCLREENISFNNTETWTTWRTIPSGLTVHQQGYIYLINYVNYTETQTT